MLHGLHILNSRLEKVLEWLLLALLALFLILILYQVISRNFAVLPPIYWTEEISRFSFQWTIMLGTALGVYHSDHFVLDAFPKGSRIDIFCRYLREIVLLGIAVFLIVAGWEFAQSGWRRHSTAAQLPMFWIYVSFTVCGVLMALFMVERLLILATRGLKPMEELLNSAPAEEEAMLASEISPDPVSSNKPRES